MLAPAYRGTNLHEVLAQIRGQLPTLREAISLADWDSFVRSAGDPERTLCPAGTAAGQPHLPGCVSASALQPLNELTEESRPSCQVVYPPGSHAG